MGTCCSDNTGDVALNNQEVEGKRNIRLNFQAQDPEAHRPTDAVTADQMNPISMKARDLDAKMPPYRPGRPHRDSFVTYPDIGPYKYPDGSTYKGQYKNGKKHGFGLLIDPTGGGYQGFFEDGEPRGHGRTLDVKGEIFDGYVNASGQREGFGHLLSANGTRYEGYFKNGRFEGKGENF